MNVIASPVINHRQLLARPPIEQGESLRGYLLRCAGQNSYDGLNRILALAGIEQPWFERCDLSRLAHLLGCEKGELNKRTYWRSTGTPAKFAEFRGNRIRRYHLETARARVCPLCLSQFGFCRQEWELRAAVVCPHHGILLTDKCYSCNRPIRWGRRTIMGCDCGAIYCSSMTRQATEPELEISKLIYTLAGSKLDKAAWPFPAEICSLSLLDLLELVYLLPTHSIGGRTLNRVQLKDASIEVLAIFLGEAAEILKNWPNGLYSILDQAKQDVSIGENPNGSLLKDFGPFYSAVTRRFSNSGLRVVRKAFREYLDAYWSANYTTARNKWVQHSSVSRLVSRAEAARDLGVAAQTIDVLLREGELTGRTEKWGKRTLAFVERESIRAYKGRQRNVIESARAAEMLGVSKPSYRNLVDEKLLVPHQRIGRRIKKRYEIDRSAIKRLLSKLDRNVELENSAAAISFDRAINWARRSDVTAARLVKSALAGHVRLVGRNANGVGLRKYLFSGPDVQKLVEHARGEGSSVVLRIDPFCGGSGFIRNRVHGAQKLS